MIEHFCLLDKVWYVNGTDIKEVVISSKVFYDDLRGSLINVITNNTVLEVKLSQLFYTEKEAYQSIADFVTKSILNTERDLELIKQDLYELRNLHDIIQLKLNNN